MKISYALLYIAVILPFSGCVNTHEKIKKDIHPVVVEGPFELNSAVFSYSGNVPSWAANPSMLENAIVGGMLITKDSATLLSLSRDATDDSYYLVLSSDTNPVIACISITPISNANGKFIFRKEIRYGGDGSNHKNIVSGVLTRIDPNKSSIVLETEEFTSYYFIPTPRNVWRVDAIILQAHKRI